MSNVSCIIIDDEPLARKGIELNTKEIDWLDVKAQFPNAIKAGEYLNENQVDLIFLDIEMPGLNGLDFIKMVKKDVIIILTTAYPQFALEAFELEVLDYLVKPIPFDRFYKAVLRAKELIMLQQDEKTEISDLTKDHFYIKSDRKYVKLQYGDVHWIQGHKDYVMLHTNGAKYMTAMNIKTIQSKLPENIFARVSKSFIVNVNVIDNIDIDFISIGNEQISLGKTYKDDFIAKHVKDRLFKR